MSDIRLGLKLSIRQKCKVVSNDPGEMTPANSTAWSQDHSDGADHRRREGCRSEALSRRARSILPPPMTDIERSIAYLRKL